MHIGEGIRLEVVVDILGIEFRQFGSSLKLFTLTRTKITNFKYDCFNHLRRIFIFGINNLRAKLADIWTKSINNSES